MVDATVDKSPEEKGEGRWKREQGNPPSTKAPEKGTGEQASVPVQAYVYCYYCCVIAIIGIFMIILLIIIAGSTS